MDSWPAVPRDFWLAREGQIVAGYQLDELLVTEDRQARFLTSVVWQGCPQWGS